MSPRPNPGNTEYLVFSLIFICLLGCIRSQLQHAGSFLPHIGYFLVVHGLLVSPGPAVTTRLASLGSQSTQDLSSGP